MLNDGILKYLASEKRKRDLHIQYFKIDEEKNSSDEENESKLKYY